MRIRCVVLTFVLTATIGCDPGAETSVTQPTHLPGADWREEPAMWVRNETAELAGLKESSAFILARNGSATLIVWTSGFRIGDPITFGSGGSKARSSPGGTFVSRTAEMATGQEITWETGLIDAGAEAFVLNGTPYQLADGRVFVVSIAADEFVVTQHNCGISKLKIAHISDLRRQKTGAVVGPIVSQPVLDANCAALEKLLATDPRLRARFTNTAEGT